MLRLRCVKCVVEFPCASSYTNTAIWVWHIEPNFIAENKLTIPFSNSDLGDTIEVISRGGVRDIHVRGMSSRTPISRKRFRNFQTITYGETEAGILNAVDIFLDNVVHVIRRSIRQSVRLWASVTRIPLWECYLDYRTIVDTSLPLYSAIRRGDQTDSRISTKRPLSKRPLSLPKIDSPSTTTLCNYLTILLRESNSITNCITSHYTLKYHW